MLCTALSSVDEESLSLPFPSPLSLFLCLPLPSRVQGDDALLLRVSSIDGVHVKGGETGLGDAQHSNAPYLGYPLQPA